MWETGTIDCFGDESALADADGIVNGAGNVGGSLNLIGGGTFNVDAAGNLNATTLAINGVPIPQFPTSDGEYKLVVSGGSASWVSV